MRAEELVQLLRGRGRYPKWRAKCPVHRSHGLTVALKAGKDRLHITCHAGCHSDEILQTLGLKWQDTVYLKRDHVTAKEYGRMKRDREAREDRARNLRIGEHIIRFCGQGYTVEDREADVTMACAAAIALAGRESETWRNLLRVAFERIYAADHCRQNRMLTEVCTRNL